eukprot:TRINITY_DN9829_c0_g1_i4.p1 TRINITY_DN9829_c0_g1~~TRINITY_DN9829_c0_g1_i4.p1  ORF type:complete len:658 (+),score=139.78 TRINITY_DN9829_c0_g1_i4:108-2081(+)
MVAYRPRPLLAILRPVWQRRGAIMSCLGLLIMLLMSLLPQENVMAYRTAGVTLFMSILWVAEPIPLSVTALLPVVLFPLLQISEADDVAALYMNDAVMLFLGAMLFASAVQQWGLHRRLALALLARIGGRPRVLLLGFMGMTFFLSSWMSNTSTTGVMAPLVSSILEELEDQDHTTEMTSVPRREAETKDKNEEDIDEGPQHATEAPRSKSKAYSRLEDDSRLLGESSEVSPHPPSMVDPSVKAARVKYGIASLLGVSYGASIGGISTLVGTGPNVALVSQFQTLFPDAAPLSFLSWMAFAMPLAIVYILMVWAFFCLVYCRGVKLNVTTNNLRRKYEELGPVSWEQKVIIVVGIVMVVLWIGRAGEGWNRLIPRPRDGTVAIAMAVVLFLVPARNKPASSAADVVSLQSPPIIRQHEAENKHDADAFAIDDDEESEQRPAHHEHIPIEIADDETSQLAGHPENHHDSTPNTAGHGGGESVQGGILNLDAIKGVQWHVLLLLGGGFALAEAFASSGLSASLGDALASLGTLPRGLLILLIAGLISVVTEFTSNVATANVIIPILASLAVTIHENPLLLIIPGTIACSFAFMLPMATPPNAIVFASGRVRVVDMIKAGIVVDILGVILITIWTITMGRLAFGIVLGQVPDWAIVSKPN